MISEAVQLALIVAIPAILSPLILAWLTNRNTMKLKEQDYLRQDAVAQAALDAAAKLEKKLAATSTETNKKLDVIHTLVNSSMTAAMQTALDSLKTQIPMMLEIIDLKKKAGLEPSVDALASVKSIREQITKLEADIAARIEAAASAAQTVVTTVAIVPGPSAETGAAVKTEKQIKD